MAENISLFEDLARLKGVRVLCVGDVMLDRFVYGAVDRISPEAPIPVLLVEREKHMLGGAGNVVANMAALGAKATLLSVVGKDAAGVEITQQLSEIGVAGELEISAARVTTVKSRFIGGLQQVLRVDREKSDAISADIENAIIARADKIMSEMGAVVISDYGKGLLTDRVIASVIAAAKRHGKPVIVDPKGRDFSRYKGASVITPNRKELETATSMKACTDDEVRAASMKLIIDCGIETVLATRGKDGMSLIEKSDEPMHIEAQVREVFDVSGAGDTVVAAFACALAGGVPLRNAALIANVAAGIAVGKLGTAIVFPEEIAKVMSEGVAPGKRVLSRTKIAIKAEAAAEAERRRARGYKVGFTNGCFDLLHLGHISTIQQAKNACDFLIVAINSDASVKRLKGPSRPVQDENARAAILSALEAVDMVVVFDEETPMALLEAIRPDVLVKGGQYKLEEVVGYELVTSYGGKIVRAEMEEGFSTTNTIAKMAAG